MCWSEYYVYVCQRKTQVLERRRSAQYIDDNMYMIRRYVWVGGVLGSPHTNLTLLLGCCRMTICCVMGVWRLGSMSYWIYVIYVMDVMEK